MGHSWFCQLEDWQGNWITFEDHQPNKTLHYINGYDKAGTKFMCIGEVVDGTVVNVFFDYLIGNYSPTKVKII